MGRTYAWTRYLIPITATVRTDRGAYLRDPEGAFGRSLNPDARPMETWANEACLAILGESGAGKSHTVKGYVIARHRASHRTLSFDLGDFGSEERLLRTIFEEPRLKEWVRDGGNLELVLDGLDECHLRIPHLPRLLIRAFEQLPRDRLALRLVCRTASWPQTLRDQLHEWWPDLKELELLPLRERDVRTAAAAWGLDADAFVDSVRERNVETLAARPMTLEWLLDSFSRSGGLPSSRYRLWETALLHLCEEPRERRDSAPPREITSPQALSVAGRIASCLILSGKVALAEALSDSEDVLDGSTLIGGSEGDGAYEVQVTAATVQSTLRRTTLFTGRGPARFAFPHQGTAEFLAARYLATNLFSLTQLLSFVRVPDIDELRIAPPLFGVAAWLASTNNEFFNAVVDAQPSVLVYADLQEEDQRRRVLAGLLARVEAGAARRPDVGSPVPYRYLKYDGMHEDLQPWLGRDRSIEARRMACDVIEQCGVTALSNAVVDVALDPTEPNPLRLDAALAVASVGPDEAKARLKPLVLGAAGDDLDDDLKGAGLMATWPAHLTEAELFENLTPRKRRNYGGLYSRFLASEQVVESLTPAGLAMGVRWARGRIGFREGASSYDLPGRIIAQALHHLDDPEVLAAVVDFALACSSDHTSLLQPRLQQDEPDPLADAETRHRLISALIPRAAADRYFASWAEWRAKLIRPDDFSWLLEQGQQAPEDQRVSWGQLARFSWNPRDAAHAQALAALDRDDPTAVTWLPVPRVPIEAPEEPAPVDREQQECPQNVRQAIPTALERADQDARHWWLVADLLSGLSGNRLDVTASPCWGELGAEERAQVVRGAQRYLAVAEPTPQQVEAMHTEAKFAGVLWTAYQALAVLAVESPPSLDELGVVIWERWCPIVLLIFGQQSDQERAVHELLIRRAYATAPNRVLDVVKRSLHGRQVSGGLHAARMVWDERLAAELVAEARARDMPPEDLEALLRLLIERDAGEAREAALELLDLPREPGSATRLVAIAAGRALLRDPAAWPQLWRVIDSDPSCGRQILDLEGWPLDDEFAALMRVLPEDDLGRLASWLFREFPYEAEVNDSWSPATWRKSHILTALGSRSTPAATEALRRLSSDFPQYPWLGRLALEAAERADARLWAPIDHRSLLRMARDSQTRVVTSGEQLSAVIQESLARLEQRLQTPPHPVRFLWNPDRADTARAVPRVEQDLSDWIADHLERDLRDRRLVVNREVEVTRRHLRGGIGDRTDIKIDGLPASGTAGDVVSVVIEVKGCWNSELRSAMELQLLDQYLTRENIRHGIYLVGWFISDCWPDDDPKKGRSGFADIGRCREWMAAEADRLTRTGRAVITSLVLDCRWRP